MVELGPLLDLTQKIATEGNGPSQFGLSLEDSLTHPLQLGSSIVPLGCHIPCSKVLIDRSEDPHIKAVVEHLLHVQLGHSQLRWRNQVNLHFFEDLQPIGLGVDGPTVKEVPYQSEVQVLSTVVVVLKEGELIQQLLGGVFVSSITCVDEGRLTPQAVTLCVGSATLLKPSTYPFDFAAHNEDGVGVATEGEEGIGVALPFVEGGAITVQFGDLGVVEVCRIAKGLLGTG